MKTEARIVETPSVAPGDILAFWFQETPSELWFQADAAFDAVVRSRFETVWDAAREGRYAAWEETAEGALALILIFDQFPRNMFRGTEKAFATDALARGVAERAIARGFDREASPVERPFFYLPLMHSEDLADQDLCVRLTRERLGEGHYSYPYALRHRDAIARFGRFPARNRALGRTSSEAEAAFLAGKPIGF
jgi:uncharacterized protein (DUF924 family)